MSMEDLGSIFSSPEFTMLLKTLCFLALVALGGCLLVYFHRRRWFLRGELSLPGKRGEERIEILDRKWLGNRQYLSLIRCGRKKVLVGISRDRIVRLLELGPGEDESA
ncbi:MAG: flagellar biosynthetic protein FliO [Puniceicoccales bacterium]|jgi:flagellar biogenesis protein FliO|nr:flagellar biosynthetic protein FliO [Puniceicoccales bacterium]